MSENVSRHTFSAVAWLLTVLCSIALLMTAVAVAENGAQTVAKSSEP